MSELDLEKMRKAYCKQCSKPNSCHKYTNNTKCLELYLQLRQTIAAERQAKVLEEIADSLKKIANPTYIIDGRENIERIPTITHIIGKYNHIVDKKLRKKLIEIELDYWNKKAEKLKESS